MVGTASGQAIAVAATPILTRSYSTSDFGAFSVLLSIATVVAPLTTGRLELAIPLPVGDREASSLLAGGVIWAMCSCGLLGACFWLALLAGSGVHGRHALLFAVGLPLTTLLISLFQLLNAWAVRRRAYFRLAVRSCAQQAAIALAQCAAILVGALRAGLIAGYALGQAVGVVLLTFGADAERVRFPEVRAALRRYSAFPVKLSFAGVLNQAGLQAPLLVVAASFGPHAAGLLGVTQRVLALPVALIGQAVAQVYLAELANARRNADGTEGEIFWHASKRLAFLAGILALAVWTLAPTMFSLVLGEQWTEAGQLARWLALLMAAQLFAYPVSQTMIVYERSTLQATWDALRLVSVVAAGIVPRLFGCSVQFDVAVMSVVASLVYMWSWELSRRTIMIHHQSRAHARDDA